MLNLGLLTGYCVMWLQLAFMGPPIVLLVGSMYGILLSDVLYGSLLVLFLLFYFIAV